MLGGNLSAASCNSPTSSLEVPKPCADSTWIALELCRMLKKL